MGLKPVDSSLLFTRNDPDDPRLGEWARSGLSAPSSPSIEIFGWPDDEGIRLNGGRPGAAEGPDRIRKYLYRMTPPFHHPHPVSLLDRGNLESRASLAERHQEARACVADALQKGHRVLSLGGGHDYGYADGSGFLQHFLAQGGPRPVIVNFDAHLDVRPATESVHSGTPFRRLLDEFPDQFDFAEFGLQPQCNSAAHAEWAARQGAQLWSVEDIRNEETFTPRFLSWITRRLGHPLFISLDIDVISSADAPGCSQSWAFGLGPSVVQKYVQILLEHFPAALLGIYEVSPVLDQDDRTAKLAALYAHQFIFHQPKGGSTP